MMSPVAAAATDDDLNQTIDPHQAQGTGQVVLDSGHVDMGPTLSTGEWKLQVHDDTSQPSYWRNLNDVVLKVNDQALLDIPDNPAFAFLGLDPGTPVWVVPQVEKQGVIWVGWNTQEPQVLADVSGGVTLRMLGVDGPGDLTVYLQGGNFTEPEPLWTTLAPFPQEIWIEMNTHTHANWVFSEPGSYLVTFEVTAALKDGQQASTTDTLRFAVGDAADPNEAFAATSSIDAGAEAADGQVDADGQNPAESAQDAADSQQSNPLTGPIMWIVGGLVAVTLIASLTVLSLSNKKANRAALARGLERQSFEENDEERS